MTDTTENPHAAGGRAVAEKYGADFFARIGRKGGESLKAKGADYAALGKAGGESTKARLGSEHYREIGKLGGQKGRGVKKPGSGRRSCTCRHPHSDHTRPWPQVCAGDGCYCESYTPVGPLGFAPDFCICGVPSGSMGRHNVACMHPELLASAGQC